MWSFRLKNPLLVDAEDVELQEQAAAAEQKAEPDFIERAIKVLSPLLSETQMETMTRLFNQDTSDRAIFFGCGCIALLNG